MAHQAAVARGGPLVALGADAFLDRMETTGLGSQVIRIDRIVAVNILRLEEHDFSFGNDRMAGRAGRVAA